MKAPAPPLSAPALAGLRVGLLGGSFNPAHAGHLHISLLALKYLQLDELWWMVSPQNPLKSKEDMAPFAERLASARAMARHPRILVTDVETRLHTRYTADTLLALRRRFPRTHFVWIMGADNLAQIPKWERWTEIFSSVPVAVFDRGTYVFPALAGKAARRYAAERVSAENAARLAKATPPAWAYFHIRRHPASATDIRAQFAKAGRRAAGRFAKTA
jgi:nicotinate-nucleotide adenylyltransferase